MDKFIIIDGNSLANRAFYAMPYLSNRNKEPSGAVYGFANLLVKLIVEQKPKYVAVAFDHARKTFRNEIYAEYKAKRKDTPPDLISQFPIIKQMLQHMGIKTFEFEGFEADDIIGTLCSRSNMDNVVVSGDKDLLQLINDHTTVWLTKKGVTEVDKFDEKALFEKFGLKPSGIIDLKSLMGDASDNIPGVAGVGEKTALSLLSQYGTLENVYNNLSQIGGKLKEKLENGHESALMSYKLATIKTDCDFKALPTDCEYEFPFSQNLRDFFEAWDFRSLTSRKDIFGDGVHSHSEAAKRTCISNLKQVIDLKERVKNVFAYDFQNLEFAITGDEIFYIKKEIDLFSETVNLNEVLQIFKPIFEDFNVVKITNSAKEDVKKLKNLGISLENFFDVEIARYVLYAGLPKLPLARVNELFNLKDELENKMLEEGVQKIYYEIEVPLVKVLASMECEGFKVDKATLSELSEKYESELAEISEKIFELAGEQFNINSPKQVASILFDKLHLKSFNNKKQSTNFAVLDDIRWQHEIVDYIISYRKISKLVSTYIKVYQNICENDGDVIHTIFNQTLTSTGRLSSSEPNLQNIPTRDEQGRTLRKIFISKHEGGSIISADYNQIELRLLANMANEQSMIEAYHQGIDIHTKTASEIFEVPVDEVTSAQRRDAKAVNFGIIYGISDYGLSQNIKTSRIKAKKYIENYFSRYPKIKTFMDANVEFAKKHGFIRSYFGRVRHIPEIVSSNATVRKFGERVAMNMPLQGTASDIIKMAMIQVFDKLQGMESHLILQIHDELIIDSPSYEVDKVKQILKETMENVSNFVVPLTVSVGSGSNLLECK